MSDISQLSLLSLNILQSKTPLKNETNDKLHQSLPPILLDHSFIALHTNIINTEDTTKDILVNENTNETNIQQSYICSSPISSLTHMISSPILNSTGKPSTHSLTSISLTAMSANTPLDIYFNDEVIIDYNKSINERNTEMNDNSKDIKYGSIENNAEYENTNEINSSLIYENTNSCHSRNFSEEIKQFNKSYSLPIESLMINNSIKIRASETQLNNESFEMGNEMKNEIMIEMDDEKLVFVDFDEYVGNETIDETKNLNERSSKNIQISNEKFAIPKNTDEICSTVDDFYMENINNSLHYLDEILVNADHSVCTEQKLIDIQLKNKEIEIKQRLGNNMPVKSQPLRLKSNDVNASHLNSDSFLNKNKYRKYSQSLRRNSSSIFNLDVNCETQSKYSDSRMSVSPITPMSPFIHQNNSSRVNGKKKLRKINVNNVSFSSSSSCLSTTQNHKQKRRLFLPGNQHRITAVMVNNNVNDDKQIAEHLKNETFVENEIEQHLHSSPALIPFGDENISEEKGLVKIPTKQFIINDDMDTSANASTSALYSLSKEELLHELNLVYSLIHAIQRSRASALNAMKNMEVKHAKEIKKLMVQLKKFAEN